jgi:hypothetical protein
MMTILIDGAFGGDNPNARDNSPGHWARTKLSPEILAERSKNERVIEAVERVTSDKKIA